MLEKVGNDKMICVHIVENPEEKSLNCCLNSGYLECSMFPHLLLYALVERKEI